MHADDDRRLMADSLARHLQDGRDTSSAQRRAELGAGGWLWPWKDDLLLPRAEHVALVAQAIGRAAAPVPYPAIVFAAGLLEALPVEGGAPLLEALAAGEAPVAVVVQRGAKPALAIDAAQATTLLVARQDRIGSLPGVRAQRQPLRTLDGHAAALVQPVEPPPLVQGDAASHALSHAIDWAVLASCALVTGLLQRLVEQTVAHVKTRRQFNVAVASFQSVQHRAVDMHVAVEELAALLQATTAAMDTPAQPQAIDRLRTKCGRSARLVMQGAVQLHGAMGLTEELPVGHAVLCVEAELARYRSPAGAAARLQEHLLAQA